MQAPCKCGGTFEIFGGHQLRHDLWTHHQAVCFDCHTFLHSDFTQDYEKGIDYLNKQMIDRIERFNKEKESENQNNNHS